MSPQDPVTPFATHRAQRLTILFGARDRDHHGSLLVHLMKHARHAKLAGATAFEAFEGYGASGQVHRTRTLADDAPVTIIIVDQAEKIEAFLASAADLLVDVFVTLVDVDVVEL